MRRFLNFVNVFLQFVIISHIKVWAFHLNKLKFSLPMNAFCQVWLKLAQWFYRRRFLNFVNVFSLFHNHLPLEKGGGLHLNNLIYHSPKDDLFQVWLKLSQWFWRKRFVKIVNVFSLFHNILPFGRRSPSLKQFEFPSFKDDLCQFGWNWLSGSGEEDFSNS